MSREAWRALRRAALLMLAYALSPAVEARAQWGGMGFGGLGWGFGMFRPVPSPTDYINSKSLVDAGRGGSGPTNFRPYGDSPNAYWNRVRDNGMVPRYEVARRQPAYRRYSAPPAAQAEAAQPVPRPITPLNAFFEGTTPQLIWPGDAPTGDLKAKREAADSAVLLVYSEVRQNGVASIAAATDARQKLVDYGRPALDEIREHRTPATADAFHHFLLSLYDSLAQATTPGLAASK